MARGITIESKPSQPSIHTPPGYTITNGRCNPEYALNALAQKSALKEGIMTVSSGGLRTEISRSRRLLAARELRRAYQEARPRNRDS